MKAPPPAEFERLLNALADGIISDAEEQTLAAWLKRDAAARQHYRDFMALHAALHWDYVHSAVTTVAREEAAELGGTMQSHAWKWWLPLAVTLLIAGFLSWKMVFHRQKAQNAPGTVAVLASAAGAVWEGISPQNGQALPPGVLRLKSGAAQLEFSRGARLILEGPADFQLTSDNSGFLQRGKLRAQVPGSAHGFTIRAEGFSVVDRGTEFGCVVPEQGKPEVHVFGGSVDVQAGGGAPHKLAKAEAVRLSGAKIEAIPARPELFMSDETFARLALGVADSRLAEWRQASAALSAHPSALVHFDFEQAGGAVQTLANRARGLDAPASIAGCEAAPGRWPGKGALEFKRADDRVRFTVPGELRSITLLAWVRLDGLPHNQSSLLMGEAEEPGEVHWYFRRDGALGLGVIAPDGRWRGSLSERIVGQEFFGTWIFVAACFDEATGSVRHYFNGNPVGTGTLDGVKSLRLRTVEIGNWGVRPGVPLRASSVTDDRGYVRSLQGCVDEFAILSTALSADEIRRLYQQGRPSPDPVASVSR